MMAEMIRTSLFCDVYDNQTTDCFILKSEDTPTEHYNENMANGNNTDNVNQSREFIQPENKSKSTDTNKEVQELKNPQSNFVKVTHTPNGVHDKTLMDSNNALLQSSMEIQASQQVSYLNDDLDACVEFWTRMMLAAKVELSAFRNENPGSIFGDFYLNSIVRETTLNTYNKSFDKGLNSASVDLNSDKVCKTLESKCCKIPYCNTAIIIAAIYTSGMKSLSGSAIVERIKEMFPECEKYLPANYRNIIMKCIRKTKYVVKNSDGNFSIVPGKVYMSIFCRRDHSTEIRKKYATLIQDHLGVPDMLDELGFEVAISKKVQDNLLVSGKQNIGVGILQNSSVTDRITKSSPVKMKQSVSVKRKCETESDKPKKVQCLKLPVRPCFNDDVVDHQEDKLMRFKCDNQTVQDLTPMCPVQMFSEVTHNLFTSDHHRMVLPMRSVQYVGFDLGNGNKTILNSYHR